MNNAFFQITNIETLRYSKQISVVGKNGVPKNKTIYPFVEKVKELIDSGMIGYIIVDECHKCKDAHSRQGSALLELKECPNVCMSGTFLLNSPIDLFTVLQMSGAENHSLTQFKQHYCIFGGFGGHQIVSYKNLGELQTLLSSVMIRRLKKDNLDLPPKIDTVKYVELDKDQQAIYDEIKEETIDNIANYRVSNIDKISKNMTPLTMLTRLRQTTGNPNIVTSKKISNAKFDMLKDIVEELNTNNEKFIVFSNWTSVLNDAYKLLTELGLQPALYTGENTKTREVEKNRFKTDNNCRCICGTIGAMGTGITLTEATTVIFLDEPWNRGTKEQAEDRAYRIGTTKTVNIITLIAKDTIDEKVHNLVYRKGKMSDVIVDKEIDAVANEQMVQYLLS
jgi:SNF2 family DNA or RNA helicase